MWHQSTTVHEGKKVVLSDTYARNFSPFAVALICKVLTGLYILCERLVLSPLKSFLRELLPSYALIIDNNVLCARIREGLHQSTRSFLSRSSDHLSLQNEQKGAALVEASAAVGVFMLFVISLIDITRVNLTTLSIQHTLVDSARWGITGDTIGGFSREDSIVQTVINIAAKYKINLSTGDITLCRLNAPTCTVNSVGTANEPFVITIKHDTDCLMNIFDMEIKRSIVARNEPF